MDVTQVLIIIPSRYDSTRLPAKALADICGKTLIQRTYEQCTKVAKDLRVVVATDDERIKMHVKSFEGEVFLTSLTHRSGTDRCAELSEKFPEYSFIINVQGDEPFIAPESIDLLISSLFKKPTSICTLVSPFNSDEDVNDPNLVKVVMDNDHRVLLFSRSRIPVNKPEGGYFKHIGIYGFPREILQKIARLKQSKLELAESLEQLRWMEYGYPIHAFISEHKHIGVDTQEDLEQARLFAKRIG